jgi:hypothetical protein
MLNVANIFTRLAKEITIAAREAEETLMVIHACVSQY